MWQWRSDTVYYVFFRDPKAKRSGKHRRGADGIIRPSPAVFCGLHGLTDDTADGIGGTRGLTQAAHRVRRWKAASPSPCRAPAHLPSETADNSSCCRTGGRVYTFITMNTYSLLQKWPLWKFDLAPLTDSVLNFCLFDRGRRSALSGLWDTSFCRMGIVKNDTDRKGRKRHVQDWF